MVVGKRKLKKWAELETYEHVIQPPFEEVYKKDFYLKGKWASTYFKNDHPVIIELGCGKGEYTIGLARRFRNKNFIGIDIKGARMWKGAKIAKEEELNNVAFIRTRIELINSFFGRNEVDEIWLTFPDPQIKKKRNKKRLTGSRFLNSYKQFLRSGGSIHLKTDNTILYNATLDLIKANNLSILQSSEDLYAEPDLDSVLAIQTFYEKQYREQECPIKYIRFHLDRDGPIKES
ncbi:MAG: tRNA (guanosine(46)-N7)-methyltransferase TrmB [Bacteroidales bacterium]|nr:MAG: tRNA (guanosine(46)-N7)-methyltransferase TrmB [Bacteroidales bacterium]